MNQEILHQLKELRQDVRNSRTGLPNPYVRLERIPSPPPLSPPRNTRRRKIRRTRRRLHQQTVRRTVNSVTTSATEIQNTETDPPDCYSAGAMDYVEPTGSSNGPDSQNDTNAEMPEVIVKVETGSPVPAVQVHESLDDDLLDDFLTLEPLPSPSSASVSVTPAPSSPRWKWET